MLSQPVNHRRPGLWLKNLGITLLSFALLTCNKDDEFNLSRVPGQYKGGVTYFTANQEGGIGMSVGELSKYSDYSVTISEADSVYRLSFDKSFKYSVQDIDVVVNKDYPNNSAELVSIKTLDGQSFSNFEPKPNSKRPSNSFSASDYLGLASGNLTLKSNNPDSVYFLEFWFQRSL